jgi:hypothetical protein
MLTESDLKLLTLAIGECWHEYQEGGVLCVHCGRRKYTYTGDGNRTFLTAEDWETVLQKVVRPNIIEFDIFLQHWKLSLTSTMFWLLLSIEERIRLVVNFIRANPELFKKVLGGRKDER